MITLKDEEELVEEFTKIMLAKLRVNKHKSHWDTLTIEQALFRLDEEIKELKEVCLQCHISHVKLEAADVANFAMFVFARAHSLKGEG